MLHYQMYKALADDRERELVAAAKRHAAIAALTHNLNDTSAPTSRQGVTGRLMTLLRLRPEAGTVSRAASARSSGRRVASARGGSSTITSGSGAGPIGCSA